MTDVPKILVVDDEQAICYVLKLNLEMEGFSIDTACSAEEALKMRLERYDLLLLDVMMEQMSGFELAKTIRQREELKNVPIIFCTAKDSEADLLEGFDSGADDYIRKPFSMRELVARVKSVLHRSGRYSKTDRLACESLVLDLAKKECLLDGEPVSLTDTEFDLLAFFLKNPDTVHSRSDILIRVWTADVCVIDRTVDVFVGRLRKKIGRYGNRIFTKQGFGYGFKTKG
ncbi:MAG: response regulator transcription factor [Bacteroidales bacterium]|nr:response regulator transcription factor [Bacteroidales bacterium]